MAMSKITSVLFGAILILVSGCQEEKTAGPTSFESIGIVQVHQSPLREGVDWNSELELVGSTEVLQKAAVAVGIDAAMLKSAIKIEVDVSNRQIRIISVHSDEETSGKYAGAYAEACVARRMELESEMIRMKLSDLEAQLEEQSVELDLKGETLTNLIETNGGVPDIASDPQKKALDQDRMTYEKAKKALEEESEEGVLYRKKKQE